MWTCYIKCPKCLREASVLTMWFSVCLLPVLLVKDGTFRRQGLAEGIQVAGPATLKEPWPWLCSSHLLLACVSSLAHHVILPCMCQQLWPPRAPLMMSFHETLPSSHTTLTKWQWLLLTWEGLESPRRHNFGHAREGTSTVDWLRREDRV